MPARTSAERDRPHVNRAGRDSPAGEQFAVIRRRGRPRQNKAEVQGIGVGDDQRIGVRDEIGEGIDTQRVRRRYTHGAARAAVKLHCDALHPWFTRQLVVQVAVEEDGTGNRCRGVVALIAGIRCTRFQLLPKQLTVTIERVGVCDETWVGIAHISSGQ